MPLEEDELDDRELPDPSDMDQDDYTLMSRCPNCKKMIDEQSEMCPKCGYFISQEDAPRKVPVWIILGAVLMLVAMLMWIFR